jgi:type IV secretory pathway VirB10-like protein
MKNNETGEFELVLGNNQLVVGFLIVALLFGVAFAMGYIVGRNSTPSAKLQAENTAPGSGTKDARPQPASAAPAAQPPSAPPADQPAAAPAADQPAPTTQPAPEPEPQPVTQPARDAAPSESPSSGQVAEAPSGSYWQVVSTSKVGAEAVMQTLKEKGLPVVLSPGPNNLVRVLAGPYGEKDSQSLGRAKTQLESAGFHPIPFRK